jgi:predicted nicotinamide N-methyase
MKLKKIVGKRVVDLGAGDGRVLAAALVLGAQSAVGYQLPGNIAQKLVFDAVIFRMISSSAAKSCHCKWNGIDIEEVDIFFVFIFTAKLTRMAFEINAISDFFLHRPGRISRPDPQQKMSDQLMCHEMGAEGLCFLLSPTN